MPKGYWFPGLVWNSLHCQDAGTITTNSTLNCLRNTAVWILDDSNGFRNFQSLKDFTKCKNVIGNRHFEPFCYMSEIGLNLSCKSHENPRYARIQSNKTAASVSAVLDTVQSSGCHMIIIHYYLDYTPSHLGVLYLRMKKLREAIVRLLERNVDVVIGIRGPHIATKDWDYNHSIRGDPLGPPYFEIIRDVLVVLGIVFYTLIAGR